MNKNVFTGIAVVAFIAIGLFIYRTKIVGQLEADPTITHIIENDQASDQMPVSKELLEKLAKSKMEKPRCDEKCPGCDECPVRFAPKDNHAESGTDHEYSHPLMPAADRECCDDGQCDRCAAENSQ